MSVRLLGSEDASAFQALRLRGLRECPTAFASSCEEESKTSLAVVAERLTASPSRAMFGAFNAKSLAGVVGIQREEMRKLRHKAFLWGMYVAPELRNEGAAVCLHASGRIAHGVR